MKTKTVAAVQTGNSIINQTISDSELVVTPNPTYFLTEYVEVLDPNDDPHWVIVSYDGMTSFSLGSRLEGLNCNPKKISTESLAIKTLYSVTNQTYDVYWLRFCKTAEKGKMEPVTAEVYFDDSYCLYPPQPLPEVVRKHFKKQIP